MPGQASLTPWLVVLATLTSTMLWAQNPPASRKWQDATGQFSIVAQLIGLKDGKVELKKADGKVILIPLEKLAAADQIIAKSLAPSVVDNPFEADVRPATATATPAAVADPTQVELVSHQGTKWLKPGPTNSPWKAAVDGKVAPQLITQPIEIPLKDSEFAYAVALDDANHHVWVSIYKDKHRSDFERVDLKTGERLTAVPAKNEKMRLHSVSPSGKLAAIAGAGFRKEIQIVEISPTMSKLVRTIQPFHAQASFLPRRKSPWITPYDCETAFFIDDSHLLVQDMDSAVAVIDLNTLSVTYRLDAIGDVVLSPGRKYFAMKVNDGVHLIESLTGKDLGKLQWGNAFTPYFLAMSYDGTRLAGAGPKGAIVWNLETGKQEVAWSKVELSPYNPWVKFAFSKDNDHLVLGGNSYFSLKTGSHLRDVMPGVPEVDWSYAGDHAGRTWNYSTVATSTIDVKLTIKSAELAAE